VGPGRPDSPLCPALRKNMIRHTIRPILAVVLICAIAAMAKPPTTRPLNAPATRPTTNPSASGKFPSAREMAAKLLGQHEKQKDLLKVAHIDLNRKLGEKPAAFALFEDDSLTLQSLTERLQSAREDKDVRAVL